MKRYATAGFVVFMVMECLSLGIGYFTGKNEALLSMSPVGKIISFIYLTVGTGAIGSLLGFLFGRFLASRPTRNEYLNACIWLVALTLVLSVVMKGPQSLLTARTLFEQLISIALALAVVWFAETLKRRKSQDRNAAIDSLKQ